MPKNYKELYEERAAIMQFDGGLSQEEAEEKALFQVKNDFIKDKNLDMKKAESYREIAKFKKELKNDY
jgi:hypothetical protein